MFEGRSTVYLCLCPVVKKTTAMLDTDFDRFSCVFQVYIKYIWAYIYDGL